tara:strand:+ start:495 stop:1058 length:564 start_codon:yes stop_codon:yes gene_type:complete
MSQIEERDKRIQSLEGVVELYQQIEKDLLHDRRGSYSEPSLTPQGLEKEIIVLKATIEEELEELEEVKEEREEAQSDAIYWEEARDELQDEYDDLDEKLRDAISERDEALKKVEELKTSRETSINYWKSKADNDTDTSQAVITMLKDENEVNKKNMFRFMQENKQLREEVQGLKKNPSPWFHPLTKM